MVEKGSGIGIDIDFKEAVEVMPLEDKDAEAEEAFFTLNATGQQILSETSGFALPLISFEDYRRINRRYQENPGGVIKPRLDNGAMGSASYAKGHWKEGKWETRHESPAKKSLFQRIRRGLEERYAESAIAEIFTAGGNEPQEIKFKMRERRPRIRNHRRVRPLNVPGVRAWETVRTT